MSTNYVVTALLQGMLRDINKITGKQDTDLTGCVNTLLNGDGQGTSGGVDKELATVYANGTFEPFFWGGEGPAGNFIPIFTGGDGVAGFCGCDVEDITTWYRNGSAQRAYTSMEYNKITKENKCTFIGGAGFELLFLKKPLRAGVKYTLSLEYRTPFNVVGQYDTPHAPFIGFFKKVDNTINNGENSNMYSQAYAATTLPTGTVSGYQTYQCSYTPSSPVDEAIIGFSTGCTLDGVETTVYIKNITLIEEDLNPSACNWDFTKSLTDTESSQVAKLSAFDVDKGTSGTIPVQDATGVKLSRASQYIYLGRINLIGKTIEIDVADFTFAGTTEAHIRFVTCNNTASVDSANKGNGLLIWRFNNTIGWSAYLKTSTATGASSGWSSGVYGELSGTEVINYFSGKTIKMVVDQYGRPTLYVDDVFIGKSDKCVAIDTDHLFIGGCPTSTYDASVGNQCYDVTISGVRIYENSV